MTFKLHQTKSFNGNLYINIHITLYNEALIIILNLFDLFRNCNFLLINGRGTLLDAADKTFFPILKRIVNVTQMDLKYCGHDQQEQKILLWVYSNFKYKLDM